MFFSPLKHSNGSEYRWRGAGGGAEKVANVNEKTVKTKVEGRNPTDLHKVRDIATRSQREKDSASLAAPQNYC